MSQSEGRSQGRRVEIWMHEGGMLQYAVLSKWHFTLARILKNTKLSWAPHNVTCKFIYRIHTVAKTCYLSF